MALTDKQRRFVDEYLVDLNATAAARRAGYSEKTASTQACRLLANVNVSADVQAAMKKREQRTQITQDYVLQTILDTIERCRQAVPVRDRKGDPVMVEMPDGSLAPGYAFDAPAVLKGAELLGKHLKLFTDKTEHSGAVQVTSIKRTIVDPKPHA